MSNARIIKALGTKKHAADLAGRFFDFAIEQPVSSFIDADLVMAQLDRALDERLTEAWVRDHLGPSLDRERARAIERGDRLGDWVSEELQAELRALAGRPLTLNKAFVRRAVQQGSVKHMLKSIVRETLDRFINTLKPGGATSGVLRSVGRGALGIASRAGKGILGQLGGQVESQLRNAVGGFVDTSSAAMLDRLVAIMTSAEMAEHLGATGENAFDELMRLPSDRVWAFIDGEVPLETLIELLPGQLTHIINKSSFRDAVVEEVAAGLEVEGEQPVRALFADDDQVATLRADFIAVTTPLIRDFSRTDSLREWFPT